MDFGNLDYLNPLFFLKNVRPRYFKSRFSLSTLSDIDLSILESAGVRAFIFDVDNTICWHHGTEVDARIREKFNAITGKYPSCLLSNARSARASEIKNLFGVPVVVSSFRKPKVEAFAEALAFLGAKSSETAVVGDRIMTDVVGANKAGCVSVKVRPLEPSSEPLPLRLSRAFENTLLFLYRILLI